MFYGCKSLKKLNIDNFNTNNITDIGMFYECSSLKELNLDNFNTNNVNNIYRLFYGSSDELENKIRNLYLNKKKEYFKMKKRMIIMTMVIIMILMIMMIRMIKYLDKINYLFNYIIK